jgi:hypothetical protein
LTERDNLFQVRWKLRFADAAGGGCWVGSFKQRYARGCRIEQSEIGVEHNALVPPQRICNLNSSKSHGCLFGSSAMQSDRLVGDLCDAVAPVTGGNRDGLIAVAFARDASALLPDDVF